MHVLLIEDNALVASGICAGLQLHGYSVTRVHTAGSADSVLRSTHVDLAILDLGLPDEDGLSLLRRWRASGQDLPILVLTARDAVAHRIQGLQDGADDYLTKPFDLDELCARLQALLRRAGGRAVRELVWRNVRILPDQGQAWCAGIPVSLSRRELALLQVFCQYPRQILSNTQLEDSLYGLEMNIESNALSVHIHHLRRKLGQDIIETVRGQGYRLGTAEPGG
ncbi:response regulator transcription factor [Pseudomonas sp. MYb185]|uniref:response regulator n=1 Tax=Pseudomonas sp. MYb185 TaxID=1848729 RepID=UPI000CFD5E9D|nr:response regulator transcription factor [Pseudomonas sp. MYb185]PRB82907.1 DNA-binding response regulator [Pseudomonas sp. MYb185]